MMNRQSMPCNGQNGASLLRKIQETDFSLYETVLYLDAYPHCAEALSYYHTLLDKKKALCAQYEREVGPLTNAGNVSRTEWAWVKTPWPWQM